MTNVDFFEFNLLLKQIGILNNYFKYIYYLYIFVVVIWLVLLGEATKR